MRPSPSKLTARESACRERIRLMHVFFLSLELMSLQQDLSLGLVCVKYFIMEVIAWDQLFQKRENEFYIQTLYILSPYCAAKLGNMHIFSTIITVSEKKQVLVTARGMLIIILFSNWLKQTLEPRKAKGLLLQLDNAQRGWALQMALKLR